MGKMKRLGQLVILSMCLLLSACADNKDKLEQNVIDQNVIDQNESEQNSEQDTSNDDDKIIYGVSTKEEELPEAQLSNGLIDNTLVVVGQDGEGFGNLPANVKGEMSQVLLCKDPVYNVVYYVNYGEDFFIYRLKDGKSELAVELPARNLFCIEGSLYFVVDSYDVYSLKGIKTGNIAKYDPLSGEVSIISDANAAYMIVYADGIYYKTETITEEAKDGRMGSIIIELYYYSFATRNTEKIDDLYMSLYGWKNYFMNMIIEKGELDAEFLKEFPEYVGREVTKAIGMKLETLDKTQSIELTDMPIVSNYSIIDSKIYYIQERQVEIYDLNTKEKAVIKLPHSCEDFILYDGMIYTDNLNQVNLETGVISDVNLNTKQIIYELYTDGDNIYGICGPMGNIRYGTMKKIDITESNEEIITIETNGVNREINRYTGKLLPMGEE